MTRRGTMVNGVIVPDDPGVLPDGTRVVFEPTTADPNDEWDGVPPPAATETREEVLESLRQSIAETKAGVKGMPLAEFATELEREYGAPTDARGDP